VPRDRKPEPESTGLVELLQAVLKARASSEGIAPSLVATTADVQALVDSRQQPTPLDLPLLRGWRRQLIGNLFLQVLDGTMVVSVERKTGAVQIEPRAIAPTTL
jgi:ribonuclease D